MKALLQRVTKADVSVEGKIVASINQGILVFLGIEKVDNQKNSMKMIKKILNYRIFNDSENKMNLSVKDINGELLIVSQFTLAANTKTGTRAGFSTAMPPVEAENLYDIFIKDTSLEYPKTSSGIFGANMQISLNNDGPVSFILTV